MESAAVPATGYGHWPLAELLDSVVTNRRFPSVALNIPDVLGLRLQILGRILHPESLSVDRYQLNPPNAVELLGHWKVISLILEGRQYVVSNGIRDSHVEGPVSFKFNPTTVDSHIHLDRLMAKRNVSDLNELRYLLNGVMPDCVSHMIVSLNFPDSLRFVGTIMTEQLHFTVGAHPKLA